jgi:hypothetical protein
MTSEWERELESTVHDLENADIEDIATILKEWANTVAPLGANGEVSSVEEDHAFQRLANKSGMTKTSIKNEYRQAVEQIQNQDETPLNQWLEQNIDEVVTLRPTDAHQGTCWEWYLDTEGGVAFETSAQNGKITHFAHNTLTALIYETTGEIVDTPEEGLRDGIQWKRWIQDFIAKNGRVEETVGPRTQTTEALLDYIQRSPAYTDIDAAAARDALYLDQQDAILYVSSRNVQKMCEDNEITPTALQTELDSRGLLVDEISGASVKLAVNVGDERRHRRWWVLDLDNSNVPKPSEIDPVSAAEQAENELGQDDSPQTTESADVHGDDDHTPEVIDKVSLDDDDDVEDEDESA